MPEEAESGPPTQFESTADACRWLYDRINYEKVSQGDANAAGKFEFQLFRMQRLMQQLGYGDWLYRDPNAAPPDDRLDNTESVPHQRIDAQSNYRTQHGRTQHLGSQHLGSQHLGSQHLGSQHVGSQHFGSRNLGSQYRKPLLIHIAGTKGKGSVATMVASILTAAGLRTGLYTSPHLESLNERFRIDGNPCSDSQLSAMLARLRAAAKKMNDGDSITFFEMTTAAAIDLFARESCDAIVLEVGLGGRLDSTNVFATDVTAITTIGLDHQNLLGRDHASIAAEKAGIVKPGVPVFTSVRNRDAAETIRTTAIQRAAPHFAIDHAFEFESSLRQPWGSQLKFIGGSETIDDEIEVSIPLEGEHQSINASLAIAVVLHAWNTAGDGPASEVLGKNNRSSMHDAIGRGLATLCPPARLERYGSATGHTLVLDAAHNIDSINALCKVIGQRAAGATVHVVFACSVDKNPAEMIQQLDQITNRFYLTQFSENPRAIPATDLAGLFPANSSRPHEVHADSVSALSAAISAMPPGGWIVICGSFFLAAELRPIIRLSRTFRAFHSSYPVQPAD